MPKNRIKFMIGQMIHHARSMIRADLSDTQDQWHAKGTFTDGKSGEELILVIKVWKPSRAIYAVNLRVNVADADLVFEVQNANPREAISGVYAQAEAWVDRLVVDSK